MRSCELVLYQATTTTTCQVICVCTYQCGNQVLQIDLFLCYRLAWDFQCRSRWTEISCNPSVSTLLFLLDIFFIYISNVILFSSFPSKSPLSPLPPPASQPTHSHSWSCHSPILGHRAFTGQGSLLPLVTNQAILCYIYSQRHKFNHVISLIGGIVPRSPGDTGQFILMFPL